MVLAIIPARGGSKGIHRKNLYPLLGKPLIQYTFDAARSSKLLTRIILSTDDKEIADLAEKNGIEVPFQRPKDLAQDDTPVVRVISHVLEWLRTNDNYEPSIIVLLQPTSPMRRAEHVDASIELLIKSKSDSVVSVVEVPHQFNPISVLTMGAEGKLESFIQGEGVRVLDRHQKPRVYARNGAAVYATTAKSFHNSGTLFGKDCRGYLMAPNESVDIDSKYDCQLAEMLLKNRR